MNSMRQYLINYLTGMQKKTFETKIRACAMLKLQPFHSAVPLHFQTNLHQRKETKRTHFDFLFWAITPCSAGSRANSSPSERVETLEMNNPPNKSKVATAEVVGARRFFQVEFDCVIGFDFGFNFVPEVGAAGGKLS